MASEDVIELGSSDEESEPAPKKAKPRPNAMVHIPSKLTGVTVKSQKNLNPINKLIGKGLTVTKINIANKGNNSRNGRVVPKPSVGKGQNPFYNVKPVTKPFVPVKIPTNKSQIGTGKLRGMLVTNIPKSPQAVFNTAIHHGSLKQTVKLPPMALNVLSPSVTITRTVGNKHPAATCISNVKKKHMKVAPQRSDVLTVELDDDETPAPSTASPQWYLRPEEEENSINKLEEINNAEPKSAKMIEITIDDSPVKPVINKRTNEIGAELAITIDDSPVKITATKETTSAGSDNETVEGETRVPNSKKKLKYPQEAEPEQKTIEIEVEPMYTEQSSESTSKNKIEQFNKCNEAFLEVIESPVKTLQTPNPSTSKDVKSKSKSLNVPESSTQPGEFVPIYQEFIDLCFKIENSNDMKIIVEKKIKSYYRQVPKEYTESEEFNDMVSSKIIAMKAGPEKIYLYIKDIVDELNLQRKMAKAQPVVKDTREIEAEKFQYGEDSEFDSKRQRQIRKLEKTLKKLHRAIQKLEEQEVDFDDEEDSVYMLTESDDSSSSIKDIDRQLERERSVLLQRYKERMVRVHAKFCQLTNTKMPSEPRIHIEPRPGQPAGPAKRIEKWINKKVPIGKPLPFPDFHDVLRCVKEANEEDKLGWNDVDMIEEARDLFTRCGKKLQRRRQENEWRLAASRISSELDPAEQSEDLKKKLDTNKQMASKKEADLFNKYADKQSQMKLEAVEIGDKEADESPIESEDDDLPEEALENKEKRKERLRRLIQEKSKKNSNPVKERADEPKNSLANQEIVDAKDGVDSRHVDNLSDSKDMAVDSVVPDVDKGNPETHTDALALNEETTTKERIHSISEESKVDTDVDELHLLQKLHSDDVNTSTVESSDAESPVDISDTITSSSDNKEKGNSDVISIENSSYSESETKDDDMSKICKVNIVAKKESGLKCANNLSGENECSDFGTTFSKTNNAEYNESVESILLASTDDEVSEDKFESPENTNECDNVKDDAISISNTDSYETKSVTDPGTNASATDIKNLKETSSASVDSATLEISEGSEVTSIKTPETISDEETSPGHENKSEDIQNDTPLLNDTLEPRLEMEIHITDIVSKSVKEKNNEMSSRNLDNEKKTNLIDDSELIDEANFKNVMEKEHTDTDSHISMENVYSKNSPKTVTEEPIVDASLNVSEENKKKQTCNNLSVDEIVQNTENSLRNTNNDDIMKNIKKSECLEMMLQELQSDLSFNEPSAAQASVTKST